MTAVLLAPDAVVHARVNWGRWVADCPNPYCRSALAGTPGQRYFACWECGTGADVVWPDNVDHITYLLAMRPNPATRNWAPGETLAELLEENVAHGITPPEVPGLPPGVTFLVRNDRIEKLLLAPPPRPLAIGSR